MDDRTGTLCPVRRYRVIEIRGPGKQVRLRVGPAQHQQTKGLFGLVHAMHRLTDLAVGGQAILAIKLLPRGRGNLRLGRFYRAILIGSNAKTTAALAAVIDHFRLIPGAVTAPVKPLPGRQFLFTFLDEPQRPSPCRHTARPKFVMHTNFIYITEQWLIAFHFLIGPLRFPFVRLNNRRVCIYGELFSQRFQIRANQFFTGPLYRPHPAAFSLPPQPIPPARLLTATAAVLTGPTPPAQPLTPAPPPTAARPRVATTLMAAHTRSPDTRALILAAPIVGPLAPRSLWPVPTLQPISAPPDWSISLCSHLA